MINVSQEYKIACSSPERPKSYITAKYGLFDKLIKTRIQNVAGDSQHFSNENKLYNDIKSTNYNYISCEPDRVKLNSTFYFVNSKEKENSNENIAYWSNAISNSVGKYEQNPKIIISFRESVQFKELTLYFQEICEEFSVVYFLNNNEIAIRNVLSNSNLVVNTKKGNTSTPSSKFNKIEITFIKTAKPYRYIKLNEIDFGEYNTLRKEIVDINIIDELSIDSSELSSNSLTLKLDNSEGQYDILNPKSKLKMLQNQQEITVYHHLQVGSKVEQVPLGTFYIKEFNVNNEVLEIEAYDDTYFMNEIYYGSKLYQDEEISVILRDLFDYFSYTNYKIDEELNGIKLSGYIPNVEFREALRLIAEAGMCVINKTREGQIYIFKTYDPITKTFFRNEIFKENPSRNLFNNVIDLVQYNYSSKTENAEVLDTKLSVGEHLVILNKYPIISGTLSPIKTDEYEIVKEYGTACVINVKKESNIKLKATLINVSKTSNYKAAEDVSIYKNRYTIKKIDNTLITTTKQVDDISSWKLNRSEIKYDFSIPIMPYIEVGDTCQYTTRFGTKHTFIPTRIEFENSILQYIEGE